MPVIAIVAYLAVAVALHLAWWTLTTPFPANTPVPSDSGFPKGCGERYCAYPVVIAINPAETHYDIIPLSRTKSAIWCLLWLPALLGVACVAILSLFVDLFCLPASLIRDTHPMFPALTKNLYFLWKLPKVYAEYRQPTPTP